MSSQEGSHLRSDRLVFVATDDRAQFLQARRRFRPLTRQKPFFGATQARHRIVKPVSRDLTALDGLDERFERRGLQFDIPAAHEHAIAPGVDRLHRRGRDWGARAHGLHLQVIAQNHTLIPKFFSQDALHDGPAERCGLVFVDRGHQDVRRHDEGDVFANGGAKWHELDRAESIGRLIDERQLEMRIGTCVAVTRKMLAARRYAFALQGADDDAAQTRNFFGLFSEGAIANYRVVGIGMNIEDRSVVERDADRAQFARERAPETLGQRIRVGAPEHRHWRPARKRFLEAGDAAALLVYADPCGHGASERFDVSGQLHDLFRRFDVAAEKDAATQIKFAGERAELRRHGGASKTPNQQLTSVTSKRERHSAQNYNVRVRITASAPTRIDLAGGTIDIWPLYLFHHGAQTLNAAISLRAHVTLESRDDHRLEIVSEDTGKHITVDGPGALRDDDTLALLGRLAYAFDVRGLTMRTRGESPAGAGIAGSSALNVAVCGALARWTGMNVNAEALLETAKNVEAQAIRVPTGLQDYRPAMYGGIAALELGAQGLTRVALNVNPRELERRIVLCYTGAPRNSGTNNWEIMKRHIDGDAHVFDCFERIRDTASRMRTSLEAGDWEDTGRHLAEEWANRKRLAPGVTTAQIDQLIAQALAAGAYAAKVCGAGGGGCLFCLTPPERAGAVRDALAAGGARLLDFRIETEGLRVDVAAR